MTDSNRAGIARVLAPKAATGTSNFGQIALIALLGIGLAAGTLSTVSPVSTNLGEIELTAATAAQPGPWTTTLAIAPATVTTLAGNGVSAVTDGTGTAASFYSPQGMAVTGGSGYVIDGVHIRKVNTSTGAVTTIAGSTYGCLDNTDPHQAAIGSVNGNTLTDDGTYLYWGDTAACGRVNGTLRRMSLATGAVSTLPGPVGVAALTVGPGGTLYGSGGDNKIVKIDQASGTTTPLATLPTVTINGATYSQDVNALTADATYLWATTGAATITRITIATGATTTFYQPPTPTTNLTPTGPITSAGNYLYTAAIGQNYSGIARWTKSTGAVTTLGTGPENGPFRMSGTLIDSGQMTGLDVTGNALYVTMSSAPTIYKLTQAPATGPTLTHEDNGPGNIAENGAATPSAAEPVNLAFGTFWSTKTDVQVPGRGLPLEFSRTYDTSRAGTNGRMGYGWSDSYDWLLSVDSSTGVTAGQVTIRQDNGSQTVFTPNGTGGYMAASRVLATLTQNADSTWTYVVRKHLTYTFSSTGQLISIKDLNGYVTTLTYDTSNRLAAVTDPAGRQLTFTYDASNRILTAKDGLPQTVTYTYDAAGNLATVKDIDGRTWTYSYDTAHRMLTAKDPRGGVLTNAYDATTGKITKQTDARGKITTFGYGTPAADGTTITTVTYPKGNKDAYTFLNAQALQLTRGVGTTSANTTVYTYDPTTGGLTSSTDALGHATSFTYDTNGNALTSKDALGRVTTSTYNSLNEPLTVKDPLGVSTTYRYDGAGNVLSVSRPLAGSSPAVSATTTYGYTDTAHRGDVTTLTDPLGKVSSFGYDKYGNRTSVTDATGRKTTTTYNVIGWPTGVVTPAGNATGGTAAAHTTKFSNFTGFGKPKTVTDALGHVTTSVYDADQNLTDVTDADGRHTHTDYDQNNKPIKVTRPDATTQASSYDDNGNLATQTDGLGHATNYTYDTLNRLTATTDAAGRKTSYTYDTAGRLITTVAPARSGTGTVTTTNTYDAANQLTGIAYSDGTTAGTTYTYDADGQRTSMTDGTGTTTYTTDSLHRLTKVVNGSGQTVSHTYDLAGNDTAITYPGATGTLTRAFDAAGRLTAVTDWAAKTTSFGYDSDGNLATTTSPNGVVGTRAYSSTDALTGITYTNGTATLGQYTYTRTNADLLATATPTNGAPGAAATYAYTANGQLKSTTGATATNLWTYDAADRITKNPAGTTFTYDTTDQLTTTTPATGAATTYTYDNRGNRTTTKTGTANAATYGYDQLNRLVSFTNPTGATSTYSYNGDGLRASKTPAGGAKQTMTWDGALLLSDGTTSYVYGPGGTPIEQTTAGVSTYLHQDQLGSTVLLTGTGGTVTGTYAYDPYGSVTTHTGSATVLQYNGQYTDAETGLIYLRARYYDPRTGQFTTVDPLVVATRARYVYAAGNPANASDPTGLDWVDNVGNFLTGAADTMSFGLGPLARRGLGIDFQGGDSSSYTAGSYAAIIPGLLDGEGEAMLAGRAAAGERAIVIGEDMEGRVIPKAQELGADYYDPPAAPESEWMANNRKWINDRMDEGCTIYDCGAAPGRANYPNPTSPYYQMELDEIAKRGYRSFSIGGPC